MSVDMTTKITAAITRNFRNQPSALSPVFDDSNTWLFNTAWDYGTGVDECNLVYHAVETLTNGTSVLFDTSGTLVDAFGNTLTMQGIKILAVKHMGSAGTLTVGGGSNAITSFWAANGDAGKIEADGCLILIAPGSSLTSTSGYAVTASTAENIRVLHNGDTSSDITFEIVIMGVG